MSRSNYCFPATQVNNYIYAKHNILPDYQAKDISEVANNLIGIHSARIQTPCIALYSRISHYNTTMLWDTLFKDRKLIKLRCMRQTLHIVPFNLAPIVHQATLKIRLAKCLLEYKKMNVDMSYTALIKKVIIEIVKEMPLSSMEIFNRVCEESTYEKTLNIESIKALVKIVIKELWESGIICYIDNNKRWDQESRVYGYTKKIYPELDLNLNPKSALKELVYYHIERFGPVTIKDISWWSGISICHIKESIKEITNNIVSVSVDGYNYEYLMIKDDVENLLKFKIDNKPWASLLAYEDSSLKGYFESRLRYINARDYDKLFNQIGEARASILLNGMVIGIWRWNKKIKKIIWETFENIKQDQKELINNRVNQLEDCLNMSINNIDE